MNRCNKCNNLLKTRRVKTGYTGPFCKPIYKKETFCAYCEWKGDAGAGKQLKELIKGERNAKISN